MLCRRQRAASCHRILFALMMTLAWLRASFSVGGTADLRDLQIGLDVKFLRLNDNFFDRIGVDFDFSLQDVPPGATSSLDRLHNDVHSALDVPIPEVRDELKDLLQIGPPFTSPDVARSVLDDVEMGLLLSAVESDRNGNITQAPMPTLFNESSLGITVPGGAGGTVQSLRVIALEVQIPPGHTGDLVFETHTTFSADIVEPVDGVVGLSSSVELVTIEEVRPDNRFVHISQTFNFRSDSLGPFGGLHSALDFEEVEGVLQFRGDNTVQHIIDPADLINNELVFIATNGILLQNFASGGSPAQINAFDTITYELRSLTPGVTFQVSTVPEPSTLCLLLLGVVGIVVGSRSRPRR